MGGFRSLNRRPGLLRTIQRVGTKNLGINYDPANLILYGKGNPIERTVFTQRTGSFWDDKLQSVKARSIFQSCLPV